MTFHAWKPEVQLHPIPLNIEDPDPFIYLITTEPIRQTKSAISHWTLPRHIDLHISSQFNNQEVFLSQVDLFLDVCEKHRSLATGSDCENVQVILNTRRRRKKKGQ
jgi:hypothetical protein